MMPTDLHTIAADPAARRRAALHATQRRALVDLLAEVDQPLTIPQLLERRRGLAQSSAYRNLAVLERAGVVHRIVTSDEFARYELAEDLTEHHHHLICASAAASPTSGARRPWSTTSRRRSPGSPDAPASRSPTTGSTSSAPARTAHENRRRLVAGGLAALALAGCAERGLVSGPSSPRHRAPGPRWVAGVAAGVVVAVLLTCRLGGTAAVPAWLSASSTAQAGGVAVAGAMSGCGGDPHAGS